MKRLIILISIFLVSCTNSSNKIDENITQLLKKHDYNSVLNLINDGVISLDYQTSKQLSLLHLGVIYNDLPFIQSLVEQGVALDQVDSKGNTALILAIKQSSELIAETLIDYQTDPNIQNNDGDTALIVAAKRNLETIIIALVEKTEGRLNPDIKNKSNKVALGYLSKDSLAYNILSRYIEKYNAYEQI